MKKINYLKTDKENIYSGRISKDKYKNISIKSVNIITLVIMNLSVMLFY